MRPRIQQELQFSSHQMSLALALRQASSSLRGIDSGPPSLPSARILVNHGCLGLGVFHPVSRIGKYTPKTGGLPGKPRPIFRSTFTSLRYLNAFAVVSMSWTMLAARPTTLIGFISNFFSYNTTSSAKIKWWTNRLRYSNLKLTTPSNRWNFHLVAVHQSQRKLAPHRWHQYQLC